MFLLLLVEGVYAYPYWNGDIIHPGGTTMPSQRIRIPSYYYDAENWISLQNEEFKILKLPPAIGGASVYNWDYGYACSDPLDQYFLAGHSLLGQKWGQPLADRLEDELSSFIQNPPLDSINISQVFGLLNIKYALLHSDWKEGIYTYVPSPEHLEDILNKTNVRLAAEFGKLRFYEVSDYLPLIYASNNVAYVEGSFSLMPLYYLMSNETYDVGRKPVFIFSEDNGGKTFLNDAKNVIITFSSTSTDSRNYELDIPVEGTYTLYFSAEWLPAGGSTQFLIDGKSLDITNGSRSSTLVRLGTFELSAGLHDLTVVVQPPSTLFNDSFNAYYNNAWQQIIGEWIRENGTLRQLDYIDNAWAILPTLDLENFTIEFDLRPDNSNLYGNGLVFHFFNGSAYALQLNDQPNTVELWYWNGFDWNELTSSPVEIQTGFWYDVKVVVDNDNIRAFINGTRIIDFVDQDTSRNKHGFVGLDGGFGASFDNVTITDLSGTMLCKDDFDASFSWSPFLGNWKITNGWISSGDVDDSYLILNSNFTDVMIETKMAIKKQDESNLAYPGVIFRVQDPYNYYGLFLRRAPNGDMPAIELWKRINGTWAFLAGRDLTEVSLNATYNLKILVLGWKIKVFLDGNQVIPKSGWQELLGHELQNGGIGLRSRYTNAEFDSIDVTEVPPLVNNVFFTHELNPDIGLNPTLTFQQINPTKYLVNVRNATKPFFLTFSESYDEEWKAFTDEKGQIPDVNHFVANGFANSWYVNQTGDFALELRYEPQRWFFYGSIISATTLLACITYLTYSYTKNKPILKRIKTILRPNKSETTSATSQ